MPSFKRGDWVYYYDPYYLKTAPKLAPRCPRSFIVVHRITDRNYRIQESPQHPMHVVHVDNLSLQGLLQESNGSPLKRQLKQRDEWTGYGLYLIQI